MVQDMRINDRLLCNMHGSPFTRFLLVGSLLTKSAAFSLESLLSALETIVKTPHQTKLVTDVDPPPDHILQLIQQKPYRGGFEPAMDRTKPKILRITRGAIPKNLIGTFASNGPGRIRIGERMYGHWFDGDGYVATLSLDGTKNQAAFHGKYVRTERFKMQENLMRTLRDIKDHAALRNPPFAAAGPWTLAGTGKQLENMFRIPTNNANTGILWLDPLNGKTPRLFALCEGGHPVEMDPNTLDTYGERPFSNGSFRFVQSFYSAHYNKDPFNPEEIYNHGLIVVTTTPRINLFKTDTRGRLLAQLATDLPYECFIHDSAISKNYISYVLVPYLIKPQDKVGVLLGKRPYLQIRHVDRERSCYVHIHSKQTLSKLWTIELPNWVSTYHVVDAFEDDDDANHLVKGYITTLRLRIAELETETAGDIDEIERRLSDPYVMEKGTRSVSSRLTEYSFVLKRDGSYEIMDASKPVAPDSVLVEFPLINLQFAPEQRRRYCWAYAHTSPTSDWIDGVAKIDMVLGRSCTWAPGPRQYASAPVFCQHDGKAQREDDGYLVTYVYNAGRHSTSAVILDAADLKVVCEIELDCFLPYRFHGAFCPGYVLTEEKLT